MFQYPKKYPEAPKTGAGLKKQYIISPPKKFFWAIAPRSGAN